MSDEQNIVPIAAPPKRAIRGEMRASEYRAQFRAQKGQCAIHGGPETMVDIATGHVRSLVIYLNNITGHVAGLICSRCNMGLEAFGDDIATIARAVVFIATPIRDDLLQLRARLTEHKGPVGTWEKGIDDPKLPG